MLVSHILKSKSDDGVVTLPPETTVAKLAEVLSQRRIGAVVVSQDGRKVDGIVSERDVVRELGRQGAACLGTTVESLMTAYESGVASVQEHIDRQLLGDITPGKV